ncbi:IclR family transcriptional regulator [Haloferax volcanii]|uniref:IclR family transcription regulator n=5 Tax=Haloferax volcanii TaxID=2246 RepID=D4GSK1_HALVD|nr:MULTISPECIES: IclR family transcriptional regulator [Haloferax]ADE03389.1 IclR family transcription regulator [Haloferax volcanii DS2]ELK55770.1 ArcR family transcription regulator [Haloferax sp. BAB-2207]ELY26135.1 ArcR family transcription regulator [Haloferax volcanii DS2]ELZ71052.1 ArcR family transcription regulator [Haloferax lucentense DSM 14919]ELZ92527.1 ArcR family transcription regulator [Haloferax alexandrinus JCM 10717]
MTNSTGSGSRRIQSVEQAFDIIRYLREVDGATLSETAEDMELPVSTAHIHLATLVDTDYVVKVGSEYHCSLRFLEMGGAMRDGMALYRVAKPELDELKEQTGEHTNVTVEQNGFAVQLYKAQSPESIDDDAPLGDHLYLHSTATGKAMLAKHSRDEVDRIVDRRGLPALTDDTITDREALHEELEAIRDRGYSINRGEHYPGVCAVGTAIVSEPDDAVGAISISGPMSRIEDGRIEEELGPALLNKKNIIELKIKQY